MLRRERKIEEVLGDLGYYLGKLGRPNTDYPHLVNILARAQFDQYMVSKVVDSKRLKPVKSKLLMLMIGNLL